MVGLFRKRLIDLVIDYFKKKGLDLGQAALEVTISLGSQEKRKDRKTQKSKSEEKVVGFSSASLFPAKNREAVTPGGTGDDRSPNAEENPGSWFHQRLGG